LWTVFAWVRPPAEFQLLAYSALLLFYSRRVPLAGLGGGLAVGVAYAGVYVGLGAVYGFQPSPYGGSAAGAVFNAVFFSVAALAREFARWITLSSARWGWWPHAVGVLFAVELYSPRLDPQWVGSVAVPALAVSLMAVQLQRAHGPYASVPLAFAWGVAPYLLPQAPTAPWVLWGLVNLLFLAAASADVERLTRGEAILLAAVVGAVALEAGALGVRPFVVASGSMYPTYGVGDVVFIAPAREVGVGDVVLYKSGGSYILHRVIAVQRGDRGEVYYVTKGDANDSPDPAPVPREAVVGKPLFSIPAVGWPALWLRNPSDWPKLAALLAAALLLEAAIRRVGGRLRRSRR